MNEEKTFDDVLEEIANREFTEEEFEQIVVSPIRAAYNRPDFLSDHYAKEYWFNALRFRGYGNVANRVDYWVRRETKLPVLANILKTL